jgi:TonB family protein
VQRERDLGELASALAAQGFESTELALDLILHDIAEQACQATGATGAAIALQREGEMVCRAAAGATAPDLGVRINTESGLSGACVREQRTQWCLDTEIDARVDAEACRRLGVRSIAVMPIFDRGSLVGVFEIFSPQPEAFSEQHLRILQDMARWVTEAVQSAADKALAREQKPSVVPPPLEDTTPNSHSEPEKPLFASVITDERAKGGNHVTKILRIMVVGLVIVLCLMLGFRWGWQKAHSARPAEASTSVAPPQQRAESRPDSVPEGKPAVPDENSPAAKPQAAGPGPQGGLVVYEKGKVVYRQTPAPGVTNNLTPKQPPKPPDSATQTAATQPEASPPGTSEPTGKEPATASPPNQTQTGLVEGRLVYSVEPTYPPQAVAQHIHGSVVLHARIGKDGLIHELKPVSGDPLLIQAAMDAVQQWRYSPYMMNGKPVDEPIDITIDFNLHK